MTNQVGTDITPFTIGSTKNFVFSITDNGLWWDLTGGSAVVLFTDPNDVQTTFGATVTDGIASLQYTIIGPVGDWDLQLIPTDVAGRTQVSGPVAFGVVSSPV